MSTSLSFSFEVVTDSEGLRALESDWSDLYARCNTPFLSQSFAWVETSWSKLARPNGHGLFCLVARYEGQAVLIWPLCIQERWKLWRDAYIAGAGGTEYGSVLVDPRFRHTDLLATAWRRLLTSCPAHLIRLRRVREDSDLHGLMVAERITTTSVNQAPYTAFDGYAAWDDYLLTRRGTLRRELSRQQRRLAAQGSVSFEVLGQESYDEGLEWLLRHKADQMRERGLAPVASASDLYRPFWAQAGADERLRAHVPLFALRVDGRIIAAELDCIDGTRLESFVGAYDPSFATYGPGTLLNAYCLHWAFERGLSYDFRIGTEAYKYTWANRNCDAMNYEVVNHPWGFAFVALRASLVRLRQWRSSLSRFIRRRT
jgi:CelD/BcsL family acetyltransferase involved in cellulose biosynthesis